MIVDEEDRSPACVSHSSIVLSGLPSINMVASAALGLLLTGVMLAYTGYGYDFTDEGFYLVRISAPFADVPAVSQFGIIFYPFYRLFDGSIAELRQLNLLATFLGGVLLSAVVVREQGASMPRVALLLVSLGIASTSLAVFASFLVTPNYNSLALQGLIVAVVGLVLAQHQASFSSVAGWLLTGFGGWLVFLAKPSSAAMLAIFAFVYLAVARKLRLPLVLLAIIVAILLMVGTMFALDGSIIGFVERIHRGMERLAVLDGRTPSRIFRWDSFAPSQAETLLILGLAIWTFIVLYITAIGNVFARMAGQVMITIAGIIGTLILLGKIAVPLRPSYSWGGILYGPIVGLLAFLLLTWLARKHRKGHVVLSISPRYSLVILLVLSPLAYTFGTGDNYWYTLPAAGLFWGIAGCLVLLPDQNRTAEAAMLPGWVVMLQLPTAILLAAGLQWPYRQPQPVDSFDGFSKIGVHERGLIMPHGFATYLEKMRDILIRHGFTRGTPIIDLSGQSPGVLFAVGAQNIGQPWMIGGYPGSAELARKVLIRENCEALGSSWILVEPTGPRSIPTDILKASGLPFPNFYEIAGEIMTPAGAGGYAKARRQIVYKPIRPLANIVNACKDYRG